MAGCSDDFLAEKRPYGSFGPEQVYGDWASVKLRLNYIYQKSLPYAKGYGLTRDNYPPDLWPVGLPDLLSKNTDEFPGYGEYTNPTAVWTNQNIHKYFYYGINESPWKKMRECTDVIVRVNESTTLDDDQKHQVDGQARFFRATRYFRLFKRYGGLPVVKTLQSTLMGDRDSLCIPRTSTENTFNFMIEDLTTAGSYLPTRWEEESNDWGRITSGACYALAGYIANYYASPVFNPEDETSRWEQAYELNKTALEKLDEGGFGLAYEDDPGTNASNWAKIWCTIGMGDGNVSEAVYFMLCNNVAGDNDLWNCWEQQIRPGNANGSSNVCPTAEMIDLFPMADGKRPAEAGLYTYDKKLFFLNRDPRFYRTFAFPGTEWKFTGSMTELADKCPYQTGSDYQLQNWSFYPSVEDAQNELKSGYFTDLLGDGGQSIYVRKKSQDASLGTSALYNFQTDGGFQINGQPLLAMRYTEVLLNFAEAACGCGKLDEAYNVLLRIRKRVGFTGDCGLNADIRTSRAKMFEAILYERQIELAYEGKRFDDCHRWMLFDGGANQATINPSWAPTGWGGNTCTYLGVTPLNDITLHKMEIMFDPTQFTGSKSSETDPFTMLGIERPKALTLSEDMTATIVGEGEEAELTFTNKNVQALANFYNQYMSRKDIETMTVESVVTNQVFDTKLYLMGLGYGDQENNPGVAQTIGWDSRFGGTGNFDPLSKNPDTSVPVLDTETTTE